MKSNYLDNQDVDISVAIIENGHFNPNVKLDERDNSRTVKHVLYLTTL